MALMALFLTACSGSGGSTPIANILPTIEAGANVTAQTGTQVSLTGTAADSDGTIARFQWVASDNSIVLTGATTANVSFTAPNTTVNITIIMTLTVTDNNGGMASDTLVVTIEPLANVIPTVDAGADTTVNARSTVTLAGTATDSDGTIITFQWVSSDTSIVLTGADTATASFTAPDTAANLAITFTFTVTDDRGSEASDTVVITVRPSSASKIFVAPNGDDANGGNTAANALRSFQAAANAARAAGSGTVVEFADGQYDFTQAVVLDASYSDLTFQAAAGATPVFTSLVQVTGWTNFTGNIMVADLPAGIGHVRYLQDASEPWMERSASAQFSTTETGFDMGCLECNNYDQGAQVSMSNMRYTPGTAVDWNKAAQYDLRVSVLPWHQDILPIASFSGDRIQTAVPGLYELRQDVAEGAPQAWIMNTIEGIDAPGEWASLDGKIYLWPRSGTDDIFVPQLTELIRIDDGTLDGNAAVTTPVSNIIFDGITFTGGDYRVIESNDITAQHEWMVVDEPDALLRIRNATNITVRNSTFTKSGGTGVRVDRYGQNITINNNTLSYLGRGGIGLAGRGPGYGDVNRDNEIAFNRIEYIGMEQWASVAILLDQSSNNRVHHNYIANTYFTAIAVVGPRQLAIAAKVEGADSFYVGREFHYFEWAPSVVQFAIDNGGVLLGSQEAMRFVYNYNNRIEENALIDVSTGQNLFINGQIYVSGAQRSAPITDIKTNYVERNYMYDSFNHSSNDYALYSDSDQDDCNYIGNMINGVQNNDLQPDVTPIILAFNQWAESETEGAGQITLRANITENSTFCNTAECRHTLGRDFVEEGQIINGTGGDAAFLGVYQQMFTAVCDENFPQIQSLPGAQPMRDRLESTITGFGGTTTCTSMP